MEQVEEYSRAHDFYYSLENIGTALSASSSTSADTDLSTRFSQMIIRAVEDNSLIVAQVAVVPFAKQLTVGFAMAEIRVADTAELLSVYFYCQHEKLHFLTPAKVFDHSDSTNAPGIDYWSISQPAHLAAVAGESIWVVIAKSRSSGRMDATFSIFGDLHDAG